MVSSGYHIVTGMALLFWSAISQPSSVSFVRYLQCILIQTFDESNSGATFSLHPLLQANFPYCSLLSLHLSPLQPFPLSFLVPKVPPTRSCHPPFRSFKPFFRIVFRTNTSFSFTKSLCFSALPSAELSHISFSSWKTLNHK